MTTLTALLLADADESGRTVRKRPVGLTQSQQLNGPIRCPACSVLSVLGDEHCRNCGADLTQQLGERLYEELVATTPPPEVERA